MSRLKAPDTTSAARSASGRRLVVSPSSTSVSGAVQKADDTRAGANQRLRRLLPQIGVEEITMSGKWAEGRGQ